MTRAGPQGPRRPLYPAAGAAPRPARGPPDVPARRAARVRTTTSAAAAPTSRSSIQRGKGVRRLAPGQVREGLLVRPEARRRLGRQFGRRRRRRRGRAPPARRRGPRPRRRRPGRPRRRLGASAFLTAAGASPRRSRRPRPRAPDNSSCPRAPLYSTKTAAPRRARRNGRRRGARAARARFVNAARVNARASLSPHHHTKGCPARPRNVKPRCS